MSQALYPPPHESRRRTVAVFFLGALSMALLLVTARQCAGAAWASQPVEAAPIGPLLRIHDRPLGVVCYFAAGGFDMATGRNQSPALFCLRLSSGIGPM